MKEKDPKTIEQRKATTKRWQKIRERLGVQPAAATADAITDNSSQRVSGLRKKKHPASSFDVGSAAIEDEDNQSKHT